MRIVALTQLTTVSKIFNQLIPNRLNQTEKKWLEQGFSLYTLKRRIKDVQKVVEQQIGGPLAAFALISSQID